MAAADLAAWGVEAAGARPGPAEGGAAAAAERREEDATARARTAAQNARREAQEAERRAFRVRRAELDLAWRFAEGTADAFGLHGQSLQSGGGVFDNGDTESEDAGRSFFDPALASARMHLGLRESEHRRALRRWSRVEGTLLAIAAGERAVLATAYTPHPADPALRDAFRRLVEEVPVVEGGRAKMRTVKRKERKLITRAAKDRHEAVEAFGLHVDVEEITVEEEVPVVVEMTKVAIVELAIETKAARAGMGAWLLKRGLSGTYSVDDAHARREFLAYAARERHKVTGYANLLGRVLREATAVLDAALGEYVGVGERAAAVKRAEREAREARAKEGEGHQGGHKPDCSWGALCDALRALAAEPKPA